MIKLDKLNLRILEILAQNCRISQSTISKALRVSKDTVAYRIKQLEDAKIINSYLLFCDSRKLGFTRYHLLLQFESAAFPAPDKIEILSKQAFVMWVNSFVGKYDLQIIVDAKDAFHLNAIREELFRICEMKIKNFTILSHLYDLEFTQLNPVLNLETNFDRSDLHAFGAEVTRKSFPVMPGFSLFHGVKRDYDILQQLSKNPKASISDLAESTNSERLTVRKHIIKMIKAGVILNFGAIPDLTSLGFITYYLLIKLAQGTSERLLRQPFKTLKNIFYAGTMLGDYDMIAYLNARSPQELNLSIGQFRKDLGQYITSFDLLIQDQVYHWKQFTPGIYQTLLSAEQKV